MPSLSTAVMLSSQIVRVSTAARTTRALPAVKQCLLVQRRSYATPMGPPPKGYRLPPKPEWDQEKEGTFDKVGKLFLMTEMARGMYVLLEQFFRPP
jgi:NADH dehydrogenase (ubiquinone) Fe-S protein 8